MPPPEHRLLVTADLPGLAAAAEAEAMRVTVWRGADRDSLLAAVPGFDAVLVTANEPIDDALLRAAGRHLRAVGTYSTGLDHIDRAACAAAGVRVVSAAGTLSAAVAEHTFGLMLGCARRIVEADRFVRSGAPWRWEADAFLGAQLAGRRLGVLGMGATGREVARRALAFDMEVHQVIWRGREPAPHVIAHGSARGLMAASEILTIHVPLTDQTRRLVDRAMMLALPSGAIVVNTSRGALIEQSALVELLMSGHLGGVALDVFDEEPAVPWELRQHPRAVLTPHIASATTATRRRMTASVVGRIVDVLRGSPVALH